MQVHSLSVKIHLWGGWLSHAYLGSNPAPPNMAVCFEEQRESELSLPEIETKPLTSTKADEKAKPKKRPTSGSKNVFPRARKFSLEDPERIKQLEKGFVLDGVVLSRMTNEEIKRTNPSINIGIPQYKALEDRHCSSYFRMKTVPQKMVRTNRESDSCHLIQIPSAKRFHDWRD